MLLIFTIGDGYMVGMGNMVASYGTCSDHKYKVNIELLETLHLVVKLAYSLPNETRFLADSEKNWQCFFFSHDNG